MSAGVVNREDVFTPLALPPAGVAEEMFRRRVIRMLVRRGRLEEDAVAFLVVAIGIIWTLSAPVMPPRRHQYAFRAVILCHVILLRTKYTQPLSY